jgi:NAD(P)-dependent dehydrogenase (short-subunit alcohol dehydrogenase family)
MRELDVNSDASVDACFNDILTVEGRVDLLVNNAGYAFLGAVEETTIDEARRQMETNFFGALRTMLRILPSMRSRGRGHIVNVSSISGVIGMPFAGAYAASKHALEGISESLAYEARDDGIRVTLLELDGMRTGIVFEEPAQPHPDLIDRRKTVQSKLRAVTALDGSGNNPTKVADAVVEVMTMETPPLRVVIGDLAQRLTAARRDLSPNEFERLVTDMH